jgi:phage terminase Nu1 subunit (DNA packaging protein)
MSEEAKIKNADILTVTVPATTLAKIIGVTDRQIRNLADEGVLIKTAHGKYNLVESMKNYITMLKTSKEIQKKSTDYDLDEEKAKHERLKIQKTEIELQITRGQLHAAEDVEQVMSDMLTYFRTKIMGLPSKLAPQLINMHKATDVEKLLADECRLALNELSDYDPSLFFEAHMGEEQEGVVVDG